MEEYLKEWYLITFYGRISHKENELDCYIFETEEEKIKYIEKNGLKLKNTNPNYFLLVPWVSEDGKAIYFSEEAIPNLVGVRIKNVNIISSKFKELVKEVCQKAIDRGYDVVLKT